MTKTSGEGADRQTDARGLADRIARCREQVEREPTSAAAHFNLALAYTARGLLDRAEAEYRTALGADPDLVEAWVNLGGVLLLKWDFAGAADANREAIRRRETLVEAHFNLGQAQLYQGNATELVACCRRVVELEPEHAGGHYFLAVGLLATGQVFDARVAVARATALGYRPMPEFLRRLEQAEASSISIRSSRED
jgi:tetratricopeptide (TPR) repeat protein